jgi:hypothetical protein
MKEWDEDELIRWIQLKSPNLLKGERLKKFKAAEISGKLFLTLAGDMEFFKRECYLPSGPSKELADLASEVAGGKTSKLPSFIYLNLHLDFHINGFLLF